MSSLICVDTKSFSEKNSISLNNINPVKKKAIMTII